MKNITNKIKDAYERAGKLSTECVGSTRTIASFTNEDKIFNMYSMRLEVLPNLLLYICLLTCICIADPNATRYAKGVYKRNWFRLH